MASAVVMMTSPSSLLGGETTSNDDTERAVDHTLSSPKSGPSVNNEEDNGKNNLGDKNVEKQAKEKSKSSKSTPGKPVQFSNSTKKPPRMSSVDDYTMLPEGYVPKDEDVICSWARQNHSHPGNENFRIMINEYAPTYLNVSTKYQKSEVIAKIVAEVRAKSPGGGFVKKDFYSNRWFEVGDEKARDKVGHAIRKAAVGLGKKLHGKKSQSSLAKRRAMQNKKSVEYDNANVNSHDFMNRAALMNGMNLENGFSGLSNEMGMSSMNMNMSALNRMGVQNMRNSSGLMGAMGMNGMGMNSMEPMGSYSRELQEMLVMSRLRSEVGGPSDPSLLGSSGGLSGLNMMTGMDDSAMLEELQRRRLRLDAVAKKEEAINMLRESDQMLRSADHNMGNNKSSSNETSLDFNNTSSGMNGSSIGGNRTNLGMNFMGMSGLGGASGNLDNINPNNLDSLSTSTLLSKLAAQGNSNFGNGNTMTNSLMNNLGPGNDSVGDNPGQLPVSNNGLGSQYNYDMP